MIPTPNFDDSQPARLEPMALDSMQRAEIDLQIATAKRWPRQLGVVKAAMMSFATLDQETSESCFYTLPRGGKNIQGPSVRLAEIAVSCYGNLRVGSRVISTVSEGPNPHIVIQSVCHDLEKNVAVTMEKRRRITKKKSRDYIDEDDINLAANAGAAIAFRDAVFKVVPMALIKPVYEQAKRVAIGDAKTLVDRRARMVEAFGKMGVSVQLILARLEKKTLDDIDLTDMETLIGLHTALKDGDTTIDECFTPPKAEKPKFDPVKQPDAKDQTVGVPFQRITPTQPPEDNIPMGDPPQSIAPMPPPPPPPTPEAPPSPPPTPKKPVKAKAEEFNPKQELLQAGIAFEDFCTWCVNSGRYSKANEDWLPKAADLVGPEKYIVVPGTMWDSLKRDKMGIAKCITIYTKATEGVPVPT